MDDTPTTEPDTPGTPDEEPQTPHEATEAPETTPDETVEQADEDMDGASQSPDVEDDDDDVDAREADADADDADDATEDDTDDAPATLDVHAPTGPIAVPDEQGELKPLAPIRLVEAALFTAGRPVAVSELMEATGLGKREVDRAVKSLAMEYADLEDKSALEVAMAGDKWAMQLKTKYVAHAQKLANMEIPKKVLKTLALIAFHQPLMQSDLVDMVGSKTYDHVRELHECGLIKLKKEGLSKRIVTSPAFPEYFGIPATDTEQIRTYLANKVGLQLRARTGEAPLSQYGGDEAAAPSEAEAAEGPAADEDPEEAETVTADAADTADETDEAEAPETAEEPEPESVDEEDPRLGDVDLVASETA